MAAFCSCTAFSISSFSSSARFTALSTSLSLSGSTAEDPGDAAAAFTAASAAFAASILDADNSSRRRLDLARTRSMTDSRSAAAIPDAGAGTSTADGLAVVSPTVAVEDFNAFTTDTTLLLAPVLRRNADAASAPMRAPSAAHPN